MFYLVALCCLVIPLCISPGKYWPALLEGGRGSSVDPSPCPLCLLCHTSGPPPGSWAVSFLSLPAKFILGFSPFPVCLEPAYAAPPGDLVSGVYLLFQCDCYSHHQGKTACFRVGGHNISPLFSLTILGSQFSFS